MKLIIFKVVSVFITIHADKRNELRPISRLVKDTRRARIRMFHIKQGNYAVPNYLIGGRSREKPVW